MRILFTSVPAYGHVNTILPLAREASRAGHEMVFATGAALVSELDRRGVETWEVGPSRVEVDASDGAAHPNLDDLSPEERLREQIQRVFVDGGAKRAVELVPRAQQWGPDVVIHEVTELAGPLAAAHTGARHIVHGLGLEPPTELWHAFFGPGFAKLCGEWQVPQLTEGIFAATYLDICPRSLNTDGESVWRRITPLRPAMGEPTPGEKLPEALATMPYPQTIHLTLGTAFNETPGVLETAIAGLCELPLNLVVTSGPGTDPAKFGLQPPHVLLVPYIPHTLLLPHCHLVVSHGGAGIMLGALAHGLPQLILPQGADQFMNATIGQAAGVALGLTPDEFSAGAVTAAAERLLAEPAFTLAAGRVRAEIDAMPIPAAVLPGLLSSGSWQD